MMNSQTTENGRQCVQILPWHKEKPWACLWNAEVRKQCLKQCISIWWYSYIVGLL